MNREYLKGLGLEDATIDKVMAEHGKTVNKTKDDLNTVTTERDDLKQTVIDRDTQLEDLGKKVKDNKELTAEIDQLKEDNKTATQEMQAKLDQQAFDHALEKAIAGVNPKTDNSAKAIKALLDTEKIKLDGEKLLNLDDQLGALKESDAHLFKSENENEPGNPNFSTGQHQRTGGVNPFSKSNFNLTEQTRLFKEDPEKYKQFKAEAE